MAAAYADAAYPELRVAEQIELHIQASPDWISAQKVIDALTSGQDVTVELPHGKACLASMPDNPLLLVAAGTGFAQMKSLVDYLRETRYQKSVKLFWGVRKHEDMYLRSLAQQWQEEYLSSGRRSSRGVPQH